MAAETEWYPARNGSLWRIERRLYSNFAGSGYQFLKYRNGMRRLFWTRNQAQQHADVLNAPKAKLKRMVCRECGSEDVLCDAYAVWDFDKQDWVLHETYDKGAYCNDCDGECRIDEKEV